MFAAPAFPKIKFFFAVLIFILPVYHFAQGCGSEKKKFEAEDAFAMAVSGSDYKNCSDLARALAKGASTQIGQVRIIFRWIAENIAYSPGEKSEDSEDIFAGKKAASTGFCILFKDMCRSIGVECMVIKGYSKYAIKGDNELKEPDHYWNAVKLEDKWQLCDVAWSSGYRDENTKKTVSQFSDIYFLMPPKNFIHSHFPEQPTWQFLDTVMKKSSFTKQVFHYPGYYYFNLNDVSVPGNSIKVKLKDSLQLRFKTACAVDSINIELQGEKRMKTVWRPTTADTYELHQKMPKAGEYTMIVYVNRRSVLRYNVTVTN